MAITRLLGKLQVQCGCFLYETTLRGVMTMAPLDANESVLRTVFVGARNARDVLRSAGHDATELSMGMSNDFPIAIEEGATHVRIGRALFVDLPSPS